MSAVIIGALDMPSVDDARRLVDRVPRLDWVKIGPILFLRGGAPLVREMKDRGLRVFLDLKWHDIPHTVSGAVAAAGELGVDLATVHLSGGRAMLEAAQEAAGHVRLAGVSVLTSHSAAAYGEAVGRSPIDLSAEVGRLVRLGIESGLGAIVCSPAEVEMVRGLTGDDVWRVVPGIRPAGAAADDQARTATPEAAVAAGATHLVVGRALWRSETPEAVYDTLATISDTVPEPG